MSCVPFGFGPNNYWDASLARLELKSLSTRSRTAWLTHRRAIRVGGRTNCWLGVTGSLKRQSVGHSLSNCRSKLRRPELAFHLLHGRINLTYLYGRVSILRRVIILRCHLWSDISRLSWQRVPIRIDVVRLSVGFFYRGHRRE